MVERKEESGGKECESDSVVYIGFEKGTISLKLYTNTESFRIKIACPKRTQNSKANGPPLCVFTPKKFKFTSK